MGNDDLDAFLRRGTNYRGGTPEYYEDTHDNYGNYVGDRSSYATYPYKPQQPAPQSYQPNQGYGGVGYGQPSYTQNNTAYGYTQLPQSGGILPNVSGQPQGGYTHSLDRALENPPKLATYYTVPAPDKPQKAVPLPKVDQYISPRMYQNIVLYSPRNAADVERLIDYLRRKEPAIVDLDPISDSPDAQRVLDFTSGAVYALGGRILNIKSNTFLIVPEGIDVAKPENE